MMMRTPFLVSCITLLAGCSFINDWGALTTGPGPTQDAGTDAGREDAQVCVDACTGDVDCAGGELCVAGAEGCLECVACTGCDPSTCGTFCELVPGTTQCECAALGSEGAACADDAQCDFDLFCSGGSCLYQCGVDSDCVGLYRECVDSFCFTRATETNCTDGVDDDSDGFTDCADFDCAADPSCAGPTGGEWEGCDAGACDSGLTCRNDVCYRNCADSSECGGDFPDCVDFDSDGVMECSPMTGCDFVLNGGCSGGLECRLVGFDPSSGIVTAGCVPVSGTLPVGSPCSGSEQCEVRSECLSTDGTAYACFQWCYEDDPSICAAGTTCQPLAAPDGTPATYLGRVFGACA